ncbi:MAG: hypothetical protein K0R08_2246 [Solimicrobium sp.]|nr:hypothetical protein [Solimicrobium sp.]
MNKLISLSTLALALVSTSYSIAKSSESVYTRSQHRLPNTIRSAETEPIIMGYFSNWDLYNKQLGSKTPDIDFSFNSKQNLYKLARLNTVAYAFFEAAPDGTIQASDPWSDFDSSDAQFCASNPTICFAKGNGNVDGGYGNFNKFANSGTTSGITNRLIAFGGAGHDKQVQDAMNNPDNFVRSLKVLKGTYNFTGLDFDYEPLGGVPAEYVAKLINLMKKVRNEMGDKFMITYTIIPNQDSIKYFGSDAWQEVVKTVNYINLMNYHIFGAWETSTGLQSPLYIVPGTGGSGTFSSESAITQLNVSGVPSEKIVLGYPSYGRAVSGTASPGLGKNFTGTYRGNLDLPQCALSASITDPNACGGNITYSAIIANNYVIKDQVQNGVINGSFSNFSAETDKGTGQAFVAFDSTLAIADKVTYARKKGLAGVMTWGINYDVPAVNADGSPNNSSLLNAVNRAYRITPRPVTPPLPGARFILQISNTSPDVYGAFASATLVINGGWYVFGNEWKEPVSPQKNQSWGTYESAQPDSGVIRNENLDKFFSNNVQSFTASQILINAYNSKSDPLSAPAKQIKCPTGNYTFVAGHSYNLMINPTTESCAVGIMN